MLLRNMLVRTYMQDLKDVTHETHYEDYRAERIHKMTHMMEVQDRKRRWGGQVPQSLVPPIECWADSLM